MPDEIRYFLSDDGLAFHAECAGFRAGTITFIRVGIDKLVIDHTEIHNDYLNHQIDQGLVDCVVKMAREQNRRIMCMCPVARAVFNRTPEYDDVRMINTH